MKWEGIARITRLFASDKQTHLEYYQGGNNFAVAKGYRERRNNLKSTNYHKTLLLPVHMSDLAIKSAYETELKYWASIAEGIRIKKWWSKVQIQYAMWLLGDAQRFSNLIEGRAAINEKLYLTLKERHAIQNNLRRQARRIMKKRPEVRIARSFELDNTLYSLYESESGQGISVSSVEKGKRIRIPLKGKSELSGNIRVVLFPETRSIEIHQSQEIKVSPPQSDEVVALDVGITEVFADDAGNIYGESLGEVLKTASAKLKDKGIKRNKLHAVQKKYRKQGKAPKASNIGKYNLGGKTLRNRRD